MCEMIKGTVVTNKLSDVVTFMYLSLVLTKFLLLYLTSDPSKPVSNISTATRAFSFFHRF